MHIGAGAAGMLLPQNGKATSGAILKTHGTSMSTIARRTSTHRQFDTPPRLDIPKHNLPDESSSTRPAASRYPQRARRRTPSSFDGGADRQESASPAQAIASDRQLQSGHVASCQEQGQQSSLRPQTARGPPIIHGRFRYWQASCAYDSPSIHPPNASTT